MHKPQHPARPHPCAPAHHKPQRSAKPAHAATTYCPPALAHGSNPSAGTRAAYRAARRRWQAAQ